MKVRTWIVSGWLLVGALAFSHIISSASLAQETKPAPTKTEVKPTEAKPEPVKLTAEEEKKSAEVQKTAALIAGAYRLADHGRAQSMPELLIAAAKGLATAEVTETTLEGKPAETKSLKKDAAKFIAEARKLVGKAPESDQPAITALAKSAEALLAEESRPVIGGPRYIVDTLAPGQSKSIVLDAVGGATTFTAGNTSGFASLRLQVVGELTGLSYADQPAPSTAVVRHLPIAKLRVWIRNDSPFQAFIFVSTN